MNYTTCVKGQSYKPRIGPLGFKLLPFPSLPVYYFNSHLWLSPRKSGDFSKYTRWLRMNGVCCTADIRQALLCRYTARHVYKYTPGLSEDSGRTSLSAPGPCPPGLPSSRIEGTAEQLATPVDKSPSPRTRFEETMRGGPVIESLGNCGSQYQVCSEHSERHRPRTSPENNAPSPAHNDGAAPRR